MSLEGEIAAVVRRAVREELADRPPKVAVSIAEAAHALGVSEPIVRRLIAEGRLRTVDLGHRRHVIPLAALDELVDRHPLTTEAAR